MALYLPQVDGPLFVRPFTSDVAVAVELFAGEGDYCVLRSLPGMPKTILDLGANVGLSIRLWQMWFPEASIVALEPNPKTGAVAKANIEAAPRPLAIKLIEAAISSVPGIVHLSTEDQPWTDHVVDDPTASTIAVPAMTIQQCIEHMERPTIDLCKCDIEGGEAELFRDCRPWIQNVQRLLIETHAPYDVDQLEADLLRNASGLILRQKIQRGDFWLAMFSRDGENL